ncbi:hypothetical protein OESDEN_03112 [Oesophagostomum dentatum]|uniref:Uncharacterized protein n=1 Tax=Oesophagostomum dentatum TaxID=61180 RepID=A0A0B1TLC6_OESDE|nr:hypothetical protein OESDEN_03112 [Oesophagostomum dentatum]
MIKFVGARLPRPNFAKFSCIGSNSILSFFVRFVSPIFLFISVERLEIRHTNY